MIHLLDFPYNGETPRAELIRNKITDNLWHLYEVSWYAGDALLIYSASVRNHGGIPDIDEEAHELEIGGLVNKPVKISLKDLKDPSKFP